jgi:hypothetical protein
MLFSLPLLLIVQAVYARGTVLEALKRLRFSLAMITLAGVSSVVLLPIISPHASEFTQSMVVSVASGDTDGEDSITTRVGNLYLVSYAWEQSPVTGVGARTLLPEFVDCELIMTFHRYGLLGLTMLLLIYPLGFGLVHKAASCNREYSQFAVVALVATFLIGITQGALTNSRTGVLLFVIIGLAQAWKDHGPDKESY